MNTINCLKPPRLDVHSDIDEIIWPNRYLLGSVGLWPQESDAGYLTKIFALVRTLTVFSIIVACIIPQAMVVATYWGDVAVLTGNGIIVINYSLAVSKASYMFFRQDDFDVAFKLLREFWNVAKNQEERNKIVQLANQARFYTLFFFYVAVLDVSFFIVSSYMMTMANAANANSSIYDHRLPFGLWWGMDTQSSPGYEIIFVLQSLSLIVASPTVLGPDLTVVLILMHVAGQFKIVSLRLRIIGQKISKEEHLTTAFLRESFEEIKLCIKHQQKVLSAFQYVEKLLGPLNFFQFISSAVEICFVGMALVEIEGDLVNKVISTFLLVIVLLQLLLCCWSGEVIIRESTQIARVVSSDIPWYVLPTSMQQDFKLVVCRSQKQCEVTAIGFVIMSLRKMSEVFNTALSYMALLQSMKE